MRFFVFLIGVMLVFGSAARAQEKMRNIDIDEVSVTAKRKLADIGVTKTVLDTIALRESVVNSLADVLSQNSSIFIKAYGRGTLATASFRGTAPSHTQVLWNGMKLSSPMLGMVDFSLIPSYFIDDATIYNGAGSVALSSGGLGGAITLATRPLADTVPVTINFIQGISSFHTYDEFVRVGLNLGRLRSTTRVCYVNSRNDFSYVNFNKFDANDNYPTERNKNGDYRDLHILQELYYTADGGDKYSVAAWLMDSQRGIPMLDVNYREQSQARNRQDETTLRVVANWERVRANRKMAVHAGYTHADMLYTYLGERGTPELVEMIHARSLVNTAYAQVEGDLSIADKLMISGHVSSHLHSVESAERYTKEGYDKARVEVAAFASVRYRPLSRLGFAANLRVDTYGRSVTPPIPALFADYILVPKLNVVLKASFVRNYRYPTLNDLYFQPGGNDSLSTEKGYTFDGGVEFGLRRRGFTLSAEASAFDSHINDWILWIASERGYWTPRNVKKVRSYGVELRGKASVELGRRWSLYLDANWARTRSLNYGDRMSWADASIGKQLVYIPEYSSAVTGRLAWRDYALIYKYNYYSERFTTTSNTTTANVGRLGSYYMSDLSVERRLSMRFADMSFKISVYNLFDEGYVSVLSRPMAGRNFGVFVSISPKW